MSSLTLLIGIVAVASLLLALPSVVRAAGSAGTTPVQAQGLTTEVASPIYVKSPMYVKYEDIWIKGEIKPDPQAKLDFLKLNGDGCSALVVTAMRKAGGEQEEFKTGEKGQQPVHLGADGNCVYSLKVPGGAADYSLTFNGLTLKPSPNSLKSWDNKHKGAPNFLKIANDYKEHKGETAFYLKYGSQFDKWAPAGITDGTSYSGGFTIKGEMKYLKIDGKSAQYNLPLYFTGGT